MGNRHPIPYNKGMNKNIFLTNESARRDPVVQAAMKSILARMTQEHDRASAGIAPHTVEVSPVNFLQDVMDDLGLKSEIVNVRSISETVGATVATVAGCNNYNTPCPNDRVFL